MIDLDALQAAAEAATPGPWSWTSGLEDDEASLEAAASAGYVLSAYGLHAEGFLSVDEGDAKFIAAWNPAVALDFLAEYRRVLDELERSKRGGKTLGEMIKKQCDDIVKITDSAHLIDETGDGDWGLVWERGFDMRAQLDAVPSRIARVEALLAELDDGGKSGVSQHSKSAAAAFAHRRLADAVRAALTEGEPSE